MVKRREAAGAGQGGGEQEMRDQEVLRANRELTAYFKGRRTEREARAALKIIKAFVRQRERQDAKSRPPLPGARATPPHAAKAVKKKSRARTHRKSSPAPSGTAVDQQANGDGSPQ